MDPMDLAANLESMLHRLRYGCGNAGCVLHEPNGLHTNGACKCGPRQFSRELLILAIECEQEARDWKGFEVQEDYHVHKAQQHA